MSPPMTHSPNSTPSSRLHFRSSISF